MQDKRSCRWDQRAGKEPQVKYRASACQPVKLQAARLWSRPRTSHPAQKLRDRSTPADNNGPDQNVYNGSSPHFPEVGASNTVVRRVDTEILVYVAGRLGGFKICVRVRSMAGGGCMKLLPEFHRCMSLLTRRPCRYTEFPEAPVLEDVKLSPGLQLAPNWDLSS